MTRYLFALLALALLAMPAAAQTPSVNVGQAFGVQADHDGVNTQGYKLYLCAGAVTTCNTLQQQAPATARNAQGVVSFATVAGLTTRGTYTLQASAFNADNETRGAVLVFDVKLPPPSAPSNIRIMAVQTTADGRTIMRLLEPNELLQILQLPSITAEAVPAEAPAIATH